MKKQIPQVFLGVSEADGNSSQLDFGDLSDSHSEEERVVPIKIHPASCPVCGWEPPGHDPNYRCGRSRK